MNWITPLIINVDAEIFVGSDQEQQDWEWVDQGGSVVECLSPVQNYQIKPHKGPNIIQ